MTFALARSVAWARRWRVPFNRETGALSYLQQLESLLGISVDYYWAGGLEDLGPNGETLTAQGGALSGQTLTAGLLASQNLSNGQMELPDDDPDAGFDCTDTTVGDPGTSTLYGMLVYFESTNPGATLTNFGKRQKSGGFHGIRCVTATNGRPTFLIDVGASSPSVALTSDHYDGGWHVIQCLVDRNAGTISIASESVSTVSTAFTSGSESNSEVFTIGEHRLDSAFQNVAGFWIASGSKVEGLDIKAGCDAIAAHAIA